MSGESLAQRIEALIDARRQAETDDVAVELRDALWLAQFARFTPKPEPPAPPVQSPVESAPSTSVPVATPETPGTAGPPPIAPVSPADPETQGLISGQQPAAAGEFRKASRVRTPAATALPNALAIERALRPLRKRKPSAHLTILDEEATVRELAAAQTAGIGVCIPRFRPATERWFELALIVDSGPEMLLWQRTIRDLRRLLGRQGAFADVRSWALITEKERQFQLENSANSRHPLRALHHPEGRRLVLVLTQGTGPHWHDESWQRELESLARNTPVGIVQFLPDTLWPYTRLGPARRNASSRRAGEPNHRLRLAASWEDTLEPGAKLLPFPILTLDPLPLGNWARTVMARKGGVTPCVLLGRSADPAASERKWDPALAAHHVEQFRSIAPPAAFRLLCHFAAVPLTLPVMRIIREALVPQATQTDLGAILASGLLQVTGSSMDPEMTFFEFLPGVGEVLRESLRRGEERRAYASVRDEIRRFIENQIGRSLPEDFSYVFDEEGEFELSAAARAFVEINRKTRARLGLDRQPLSAKSAREGLEVWLLPAATPLFDVLERSLQSSGYRVARLAERDEVRIILEILTKKSGTLVTVTAPNRWGRTISFSDQRRWDASYRELVAYIDSTQDAPAALIGVPALPRPRLERTVLENALRFLLGSDSPVRINLGGPAYSGKRVLMAAAAHHPLTRHAYRGGIYWEIQGTKETDRPGRRLYIEPGPAVDIRHEDGAVWFDDPERGETLNVGLLTRTEADHYFLACGGEDVRPMLDKLWDAASGRLDQCAWIGVAIREFPGAVPPPLFTEFFSWLLGQLGHATVERLKPLAILVGTTPIPEALVAALIPHTAKREALHRQLASLCLFRREEEGWWPLISPIAGELLLNEDIPALHARVVDYYSGLTGTEHWEDGYFRPQFARHCHHAGRAAELEKFFQVPDHLLWFLRRDGWRSLAAALFSYGLPDLGSRVERLAPEGSITRDELAKGLSLDPARHLLRVFLETEQRSHLASSLEELLLREGHTRSQDLADSDVVITNRGSSPWPLVTARNAGVFLVLLSDENVSNDLQLQFDAIVDHRSTIWRLELAASLQRFATESGMLSGVPANPVPYLLRDELMAEARKRLLDSPRGLIITGEPGIGKRTLATALCHMPVLRCRFPGGIYWGSATGKPNSGPSLFVLHEAEESSWPQLRREDRLIVVRRKGAEAEGMFSFEVPPPGSAQARLMVEIHSVPSHGYSHEAILRFAGRNPGLLSQACRVVKYFHWDSIQRDFRILPENSRPALLSLAAKSLPPQQRQQLQSLSILGVNPYPSRELAEYVSGEPLPEEFFSLGLLKSDGPNVWVLVPGETPSKESATQLHQRVCDYYRRKLPEHFPLRVPAAKAYYWQYIRHHLSQAGDQTTLPAELMPVERWWEQRDEGQAAALLASLSVEERVPVFLWWAEARPESATQYLLDEGTELVDPPGLLRKLQAAWLPRLTGPLSEPKPEGRAAIGRALGLLGLDNRPGVGLLPDGLPDIDWVEIPGGEFLYGEERRPCPIERFHIARYPVTNQQFQAFLEAADGYRQDRWWQGMDQPDRKPKPSSWQERNCPRENVTWFEGMAFCSWLAHKLKLDVRLPTEWQWERAARGTEGREYPWGDEHVPGAANINEKKTITSPHYLERTSAVGIYPSGASPDGVLDLSGNVWEWCLNEFSKPERMQRAGRERRVLRGGSWLYDAGYARAAYRNHYPPDNRNDISGFRVVCCSPLLNAGTVSNSRSVSEFADTRVDSRSKRPSSPGPK